MWHPSKTSGSNITTTTTLLPSIIKVPPCLCSQILIPSTLQVFPSFASSHPPSPAPSHLTLGRCQAGHWGMQRRSSSSAPCASSWTPRLGDERWTAHRSYRASGGSTSWRATTCLPPFACGRWDHSDWQSFGCGSQHHGCCRSRPYSRSQWKGPPKGPFLSLTRIMKMCHEGGF